MLVFFLGFELFGLPLVLGDPQDILGAAPPISTSSPTSSACRPIN